MIPTEKKPDPTMGIIHGTDGRADKPYQNRQMGSAADPKNVGRRIVSGLKSGSTNLGAM
jgi:hypothetical protein